MDVAVMRITDDSSNGCHVCEETFGVSYECGQEARLTSRSAVLRAGWEDLVRLLDRAHYVRYGAPLQGLGQEHGANSKNVESLERRSDLAGDKHLRRKPMNLSTSVRPSVGVSKGQVLDETFLLHILSGS